MVCDLFARRFGVATDSKHWIIEITKAVRAIGHQSAGVFRLQANKLRHHVC
jgi:Asp/Glu/hydantoin racemase